MDTVEREITVPAADDEVWELLTNPGELGRWLGDDVALDPTPGSEGHVVERDGTRHALVTHEVDPGRRLAWHWWPAADPAAAPSRVEITLVPTDQGTIVRVVEHLAGSAQIEASARAAAAWSHRLLHLEALLLVAAAVRG